MRIRGSKRGTGRHASLFFLSLEGYCIPKQGILLLTASFFFFQMFESESHPRYRSSSTMTTHAIPSYHHGTVPLKAREENSRTTSPTVVIQTNNCGTTSPLNTLNTTQSTMSTSSPLSSDHPYVQYQNHAMAAPPSTTTTVTGLTRSPLLGSTTNTIPVPVRSASWAAGSPEPLTTGVPAVITTQSSNAPGIPVAGYNHGVSPKLQPKGSTTKTVAAIKKKSSVKKTGAEKAAGGGKGDTVNSRRQKRLERNRESARLSRRRRKHYLEVLEDRVSQLSLEMDQGRRAHAAAAVETILSKRSDILNAYTTIDPKQYLPVLDSSLSRTSQEVSVLNTFQMQQLKSFALPAHAKFVLWLTLQGDVYFRGGRAASERLSAARIGERVSILSIEQMISFLFLLLRSYSHTTV